MLKSTGMRLIVMLSRPEDHHSTSDLAPWVNFQEDRYMGKDGVTYLVVDNPDTVDYLGSIVPPDVHIQAEEPPKPVEPNLKLVNSFGLNESS